MAVPFSLGGSATSKTGKETRELDEEVIQTQKAVSEEKQKTETTQTAVQDILQQTQQETLQTGTQKGVTEVTGATAEQAVQEQKALTSLLGEAPQAALEDVVLNLLSGIGAEGAGVSNIVQLLTERATGAAEDINAESSAIIAAARETGEKELQALQPQLAQQAGGSLANFGVVAGVGEGRVQLETQLAALRAQLATNARATETEELGQLLTAAGAEESQIAPLLQILKGAQVEQVGTTTTAQEATQRQTQKQDIETTQNTLADIIAQTLGTTQTDTISNVLAQATSEQESELNRLINEITRSKSSGRETQATLGFSF